MDFTPGLSVPVEEVPPLTPLKKYSLFSSSVLQSLPANVPWFPYRDIFKSANMYIKFVWDDSFNLYFKVFMSRPF